MHEQFRSEIIVSHNILNELKRYLAPPYMKKIFMLGMIPCFMFIIMGPIVGDYIYAIIALIVAVAFTILYILQPKIFIKKYLDMNLEATGTAEISQTVSFFDDMITVTTENTGGTLKFSYASIARYVETKSAYSFFTKSNILIVVDKLVLIEEGKEKDFVQFINEKCRDIKIK